VTLSRSRLCHSAMGKPICPPVKRSFTPVATVICAGCEAVEFTKPDHMPKGWTVEQVAKTAYAFCPSCGLDVPQGGDQ
jgi:hypothetical protein